MQKTAPFEIRRVDASDPACFLLSTYAFAASPATPTDEDKNRTQYLADTKIFMTFDEETPLAQLGIHPMTLNVRGTVMPMGGITAVATMPAGRRGGRIKALMGTALKQMRDDAQPVSTLYPFKESFYERLGYVSYPSPIYLKVNPADLSGLMQMEHLPSIEHMRIADGYEDWGGFLKRYQTQCHGFALQDATRHSAIKDKNEWWLVLVREDGEITGAMTYRLPGEDEPMHVKTLLTITTAARYRCLEWIARHMDQVPNAQIPVLPGEHPELWWPDMSDNISTSGVDAWGPPMGRIVSIDALSGISAGDGEVTIDVTDNQAPWNSGTWTLRGKDGVLDVSPGGTPTATITIQGLSSLLFSGTDVETLRFRGWGDVDSESAAQLRSIFPAATPYLNEQF